MLKGVLGVIAGCVVWLVVATLTGLVMRASWPEYARVADAMTFTLPMMIARLSIGAIATLAMGWVTAAISGRSMIATITAGAILLLGFIPQHVMLWDKFPVWYHLTFLLSLVPLTYVGGRYRRASTNAAMARSATVA